MRFGDVMRHLPPMSSEEVPVHLPTRAEEPYARVEAIDGRGTASDSELWHSLTRDHQLPSTTWWENAGFASEFDALVAQAKRMLGV